MNRILLLVGILLTQLSNAQGTSGSGVTIDGYTYATVIINGREWMAENLKATKWESGTTFQTVTTSQLLTAPMTNNIQTGPYATPAILEPSWSSANGNGKLYNFPIVYNQSQVIKTGWRIPTKQEWLDMIVFTNASTTDNMRKLEPNSSINYWTCTGNLIDQYGFSAIGVGRVLVDSDNTTATMDFVGDGAFFWSVAVGEDNQTNVSAVNINCNGEQFNYMNANWSVNRRSALSVRLIKDAPLSTNEFDKSKVIIYPNPAKDYLNIKSENEITELSIIDITGKIVYLQKNISSSINIEKLQRGLYIIKLATINGTESIKLIKN